MKAITNVNPRDLKSATAQAQRAQRNGVAFVMAGGGSDVLGMMKDHLITPDVVINLKAIKGLDEIRIERDGLTIGGLTTLDTIARHQAVRQQYRVLAEAAGGVATPQIRNVATIAGNVCQRPWCWYYRQGFHCFKAGGNVCYSVSGENQFHAIFGGGPSHIVHPSDTAPALIALNAAFRIVGPSGERTVPAADFFTLPTANPLHENVLKDGEVLAAITVPAASASTRSTYHKVMDREAWTHAVVSAAIALDMSGDVCQRARIVLGGVAPIPWRLPEVERMLAGQRITPELAAKAGEAAVAGARPLAKNGYKVPLTKAVVKRTLESLGRSA